MQSFNDSLRVEAPRDQRLEPSPAGAMGEGPAHVAIIMDGNGRWASDRGWPRIIGHHHGARAVRRIIESAPEERIRALTLYAFSADNWARPLEETSALMNLFFRYLRGERDRCIENGVRVQVIGRRDRLPRRLVNAISEMEHATRDADVLDLRLAVDYSARDSLRRAAQRLPADATEADFNQVLAEINHATDEIPPVDLLIRTGGERRLSDFLLWESAYAELYFTKTMWPEFGVAELRAAVCDFRTRERRFGRCSPRPIQPARANGAAPAV